MCTLVSIGLGKDAITADSLSVNPDKDTRELEKLNDTDCKKLADSILKVYKYLQTNQQPDDAECDNLIPS